MSECITVCALSPPSPAAVEEEEETRSKAELIHSVAPSGWREAYLPCQTVGSRGNLGLSSLLRLTCHIPSRTEYIHAGLRMFLLSAQSRRTAAVTTNKHDAMKTKQGGAVGYIITYLYNQ